MAKVQYGPIVTSASGKVAGIVFSIWKGISYIKRWVKPTYTDTPAQQAIRTAFATLVQQWKYLTARIVAAWDAYVADKAYTNRNAFLGANVIDFRDQKILTLSPHNPEFFPAVGLTVDSPTTGWVMSHWSWPLTATAGDVAVVHTKLFQATQVWHEDYKTFPATNHADLGRTPGNIYEQYVTLLATVSKGYSASVGATVECT
jgi:hypothetical protein